MKFNLVTLLHCQFSLTYFKLERTAPATLCMSLALLPQLTTGHSQEQGTSVYFSAGNSLTSLPCVGRNSVLTSWHLDLLPRSTYDEWDWPTCLDIVMFRLCFLSPKQEWSKNQLVIKISLVIIRFVSWARQKLETVTCSHGS